MLPKPAAPSQGKVDSCRDQEASCPCCQQQGSMRLPTGYVTTSVPAVPLGFCIMLPGVTLK